MDYKQLIAHIERRDFSPLYLLYGQGEFQRDETLSLLVESIVAPSNRDFNLSVFYSDQTAPETVVNAVTSFPLMSAKRVVVLKRCEQMSQKMAQALLPLISDPPETTSFILVGGKMDVAGGKTDTRREVFSLLLKRGTVVEFKPLYDRSIPGWIEGRVKRYKKKISSDAVRLLHQSAGSNLGDLANEIEKLSISVSDRPQIDKKDVEDVVGYSRSESIFDLTDAIGEKDTSKALFIAGRMSAKGEKGTRIVAAIFRHLMILLKVQKLEGSGLPPDELSKKLRVHPYFVKNYLAQAKNFLEDELLEDTELLLQADSELKGGRTRRGEKTSVETLVRRLCTSSK